MIIHFVWYRTYLILTPENLYNCVTPKGSAFRLIAHCHFILNQRYLIDTDCQEQTSKTVAFFPIVSTKLAKVEICYFSHQIRSGCSAVNLMRHAHTNTNSHPNSYPNQP